jgi:hypothetical protein
LTSAKEAWFINFGAGFDILVIDTEELDHEFVMSREIVEFTENGQAIALVLYSNFFFFFFLFLLLLLLLSLFSFLFFPQMIRHGVSFTNLDMMIYP